jgi:hypothetical protein
MKRNIRRNYTGQTVTLSVHSLDVWGNARDGYDVNDVYPSSGTIIVPIDATDDEVIAALKADGFVKRNVRKSSIRIDGEPEYGLFIEYAPTCHPEYELRRVRD